MNDYQKQAQDFLTKSGTSFKAKYLKHALYFVDDKEPRDIYRITLKRNGEKYSFKFGQSIAHSDYGKTAPTEYDVLAALTKCSPENFDYFCSEYGYNSDSREAEKIYKAVQKEYNNIIRLFGEDDTIEELRNIQ